MLCPCSYVVYSATVKTDCLCLEGLLSNANQIQEPANEKPTSCCKLLDQVTKCHYFSFMNFFFHNTSDFFAQVFVCYLFDF